MRSLFNSARVKLTAWYLLIIMLISLIFSSVIYEGINSEFQQIEKLQQIAQQREALGLPPLHIPRSIPTELLNPVVLADARARLFTRLAKMNFGILVLSGIAGYFLAGRTLRPIQEMVDEQNRFITDASHELRTPLTALRSEMEVSLLNKRMDLAEAQALIKSNLEEVIALQYLSDNLLELAQYEKMKSVITLESIALQGVLNDAIKKVSHMAKKKNISILNEAKSLQLNGNTDKLRELFVILLDNAVKYSPDKSEISITSKKGIYFADITITDQGVGIEAKDFPYIFDRFYRSDASRTKTQTSGYGLGLSIAKKIIALHHGSINVKSKVNEGTSILIQIPLAK